MQAVRLKRSDSEKARALRRLEKEREETANGLRQLSEKVKRITMERS
jgi:hypothetical protein